MLPRLIRKAEERKEDKRARDQQPAKHLEGVLVGGFILPKGSRDLIDMRIVVIVVRLGPAVPRFHMRLRIEYNNICSYWNGAEYFDAGKGHQADVPVTIEVSVGWQYCTKLTLTLGECIYGHDWD
jgi:hypothetical protein